MANANHTYLRRTIGLVFLTGTLVATVGLCILSPLWVALVFLSLPVAARWGFVVADGASTAVRWASVLGTGVVYVAVGVTAAEMGVARDHGVAQELFEDLPVCPADGAREFPSAIGVRVNSATCSDGSWTLYYEPHYGSVCQRTSDGKRCSSL